jgi:hypothetical protein
VDIEQVLLGPVGQPGGQGRKVVHGNLSADSAIREGAYPVDGYHQRLPLIGQELS